MMKPNLPPLIAIAITILFLTSSCSTHRLAPSPEPTLPVRVLLLGNSILYTGNVPEILHQLALMSDIPVTIDMYAQPGARLVDLVDSDDTKRIIGQGYDFVVFHDRGGDTLCVVRNPEEPTCEQTVEAHSRMAQYVRASGATPVLLGTYQRSVTASRDIERADNLLAESVEARFVPVSAEWHTQESLHPEISWMADDRMHPGKGLSLLMAVNIYRSLFGSCPDPIELVAPGGVAIPPEERVGLYQLRERASGSRTVMEKRDVQAIIEALSNPCER